MRALIQRVTQASVRIGGAVHGEIGRGFLVLLGITEGDTTDEARYLADKIVKCRVFADANDKMNLALADVSGGILIVSQFTLYGDCKKGNRPSFTGAAGPETAIPLYEAFIARCRESGLPVETGVFGADMQVELINDGPVTLWMDTAEMRPGASKRKTNY
ncbi:MAG: D-aminoacyl-tRNA deacylase [Agathobaculum sp.]|uniref:D-aminoacyl-tRNA deacylase n=1 Tax=Agathobaculum sp. TaxID=2048138 RepID=UPI0025C565EB|nr:D-aminoacyl-tRNA deacylase [Agathobaculum sp.]MCI7124721.1 D-aminoacyl-tRNA deacylase [Agathobaculum sp.]MDY3711741.1 D-aminoacyl-tRNA deacylase [Agathobaculum sp.]